LLQLDQTASAVSGGVGWRLSRKHTLRYSDPPGFNHKKKWG
jgi:hypothetical protein